MPTLFFTSTMITAVVAALSFGACAVPVISSEHGDTDRNDGGSFASHFSLAA